MCHESKLTISMEQTKLLNSQGKQQLELSTHTSQVVHLKAISDLCATQCQANNFLLGSIFGLAGIMKHLATGP